VNLVHTSVGSNLDCRNGTFVNIGGSAIRATSARISGAVLMGCAEVKGTARFYAATIGNNFECDGGQFISPGGLAIDLSGANVAGHTLFNKGFRVEGTVVLPGMRVGGNLISETSVFKGGGSALVAIATVVSGDVIFYGCDIEGGLDFKRIKVAGVLAMAKISEARTTPSLDLRFATVNTLDLAPDSWPEPDGLFLNGLSYNA